MSREARVAGTGEGPTDRLAIFAHFDAGNRIRPYVLEHLRGLRTLGGQIHFVSNSPLEPLEVARLEGLADHVLIRENRGLDFGMWQAALACHDLDRIGELVLTNSSVVGPLRPLLPVFEAMEAHPCDFWSMTESFEHGWHLQSWFTVFRRTALANPAFPAFWKSVLPFRSRQHVIFSYELGLSTYLREHGLEGAAAFPLGDRTARPFGNLLPRGRLSSRIRTSRNPTLHYPDLLLEAGMPYVKVSLLEANPDKLRLRAMEPLLAEARALHAR
jgi:lipopolysaccharide biosynthesis protein